MVWVILLNSWLMIGLKMPELNIVYDHQIFSYQKYGGISRYFFEVMTRLSSSNNVSVIAPFYINKYISESTAKKIVRGVYLDINFKRSGQIVNMVNKIISPVMVGAVKPDILHETYFSNKSISNAKRKVLTVYDMTNELFSDQLDPKGINTIAKRNAVKRADHIICISKNTQTDLINMFDVKPEKTSVCYLGYDLGNHSSQVSSVFHNKKYILFVGGRGGYKNFLNLLEAYAGSNQLTSDFDLIAFGGGAFSKVENDKILQLGVLGKVHQISGDDDMLEGYYLSASALIYPSLYEGFGIPLLEAMSYKCPVICSNSSSLPEVADQAAVYFDPNSTEDMQTTIENVLYDYDLCEQLRLKGLERITHFSWDKAAKETNDIYKSLL